MYYNNKAEPFQSRFIQTPGQVDEELFSRSTRDGSMYAHGPIKPRSKYTKDVVNSYDNDAFSAPYSTSVVSEGRPARLAMDSMRLSEIDNDIDLELARTRRGNVLSSAVSSDVDGLAYAGGGSLTQSTMV